MSAFLSPLILKYIGENDEELWELHEDLIYQSDVAAYTFVIPKGFKTDLSSVPRAPLAYWLTGGKAKLPSIPHDFLCETKLVTREMADLVFLEAAKLVGVPGWRRKTMYSMVRGYAIVTGKDTPKTEAVTNIYKE